MTLVVSLHIIKVSIRLLFNIIVLVLWLFNLYFKSYGFRLHVCMYTMCMPIPLEITREHQIP